MQLPNRVFEELVMDVYDEVDRRENEASKSYNIQLLIYIQGVHRKYPNISNFFIIVDRK